MLENTAIVILNYNGKSFLEKFLPQVIACSSQAKIMVADNASTDDSIDFLKTNFPAIPLIINAENGGFAKGYNDSLKQIDAEFYLLLNSDIEVSENWLLPLLEKMKDPMVAGCQPKIKSFHQKTHFEHAGAAGGYLDRNYYPFCRGRIVDQIEHDHGQYDDEQEVFWATGAALLIRAKLFHQVGGFDESFFAHMEEIDLCWRIKKLGYQFWVIPSSEIFHVGGGTLSYLSPFKTYLNFKNSLFMLIKNHEGWLFPKLFYRLILDGIAGIRFLMRGEGKQFIAVLKAHGAMYRHFNALLKKRKEIRSNPNNRINNKGFYQASILWARFFKNIHEFSKLNKRFFH